MCNDRFPKACFETCLLTMYRLCWINFSFIKKTFINVPIVGGHADIENCAGVEASRVGGHTRVSFIRLELGFQFDAYLQLKSYIFLNLKQAKQSNSTFHIEY